jgi:hypothetical protein
MSSYVDIVGVTGSIPVAPTNLFKMLGKLTVGVGLPSRLASPFQSGKGRAFAVATFNLGTQHSSRSRRIGDITLPVSHVICQAKAATGACLGVTERVGQSHHGERPRIPCAAYNALEPFLASQT